MTIIEIRPFRNGWKCFEAPGVEPVFLDQEQAIDYATGRACFRSGEIRILDSRGAVARDARAIPESMEYAGTEPSAPGRPVRMQECIPSDLGAYNHNSATARCLFGVTELFTKFLPAVAEELLSDTDKIPG